MSAMRCAGRMPLARTSAESRSPRLIAALSSWATTSPLAEHEHQPSEQRPRQQAHHGSAVDLGRQHVAFAAHGLDEARLARIVAEAMAQAAHLHVDAAVERVGLAALREIDELVAVEHAIRVLEEDAQQPVLGAGERRDHAFAGDADADAPCRASSRRSAGAARSSGCRFAGQAARAAQDRLDARQQLARAERLGQVVVGAHLQADDAVGLLAARGEHDHRDLGLRAQVAAQRQAVVARAASGRAR